MVAYIISHKKLNQIVTELYIIEVRKLQMSTVFITQTYFPLPKDVGLNCTHMLLLKFQTNKNCNKS